MSVEEELKELILKRFKSVRAFAMAINVSPSTINNIFSRSIGGIGIATAIPMCRALNIDVDALADGKIKPKDNLLPLPADEKKLLDIYRGFNEFGKEIVIERVLELSQLSQYKKYDQSDVVSEEA